MAKHGDIISDGNMSWRVVDKRINGYVADIPNFYERSSLFGFSSNNKNQLILPDRMVININNHGYIYNASGTVLDLNVSSNWDSTAQANSRNLPANRAGKDFYIYVVEQADSDTPKFVLSENSTTPTGYSESESRKIGGFHCLCANVGSISGHTLSGYVAGNILPLSIWDLKHRPVSEPEGMVYIEGLGKWYDIYLASWDQSSGKLVSRYGLQTADGGAQYGQVWHGEKFAEKFGEIGKHLPSRSEFMVFAKGSNEQTAITGSADQGSAGGHVDTANRRMISNYGLEECCGFLWQWIKDIYLATGGSWTDSGTYSSSVDSQRYGYTQNTLYRAFVGGHWHGSSYCGSRCVVFDGYSSGVYAYVGARGASEPRLAD